MVTSDGGVMLNLVASSIACGPTLGLDMMMCDVKMCDLCDAVFAGQWHCRARGPALGGRSPSASKAGP